MRKIFSLLTLTLITLSCGAKNSTADQHPALLIPVQPIAAPVFFANIPDSLEFCGEKMPIHYPDVKEALQREISVTMYMHSSTMRTLRATQRYFDIIVPMLQEAGIPEDFKYLAMAESGLNPEAVSTAKAAGLWQIMNATGRDYGLLINSQVDMRYQIEEATKVAIRHLLDSYKMFGNWTLSAAAYNLGNAGVSRRMNAQKVNDYYELFLPEETMRYLFRIMAWKIVSQNPVEYGFYLTPVDYLLPFRNYTEITVSDTHIDWVKLAQEHGTNYKMLRLLNPWIREYVFQNPNGRKLKVKMPNGEEFRVLGN